MENKICELIKAKYIENLADDFHFGTKVDGFIISTPFIFSGGHFIELFVKQLSSDKIYISDMGNTISELELTGIKHDKKDSREKEIIEDILDSNSLNMENGIIKTETTISESGKVMHKFIQSILGIGDLSFFHKLTRIKRQEMKTTVKKILDIANISYKEGNRARVKGSIESNHQVDILTEQKKKKAIFLFDQDGNLQLAEAWAFKFEDMKAANQSLLNMAIFDEYDESWTSVEKKIIQSKSDIFLPVQSVEAITEYIVD